MVDDELRARIATALSTSSKTTIDVESVLIFASGSRLTQT